MLSAFVAPVASEYPDAWYIRLASVFPTTAPFVMPVRVAVSDVPAWEIASPRPSCSAPPTASSASAEPSTPARSSAPAPSRASATSGDAARAG